MELDGYQSAGIAYTPRERELIWPRLIARIEDGRLKTVTQVMNELQRNDRYAYERLSPLRKHFVLSTEGMMNGVVALLSRFPDLVRADALTESADPWIIQAGVVHSLTIVSNEFANHERKKPGRVRIPDVCDELKKPCIKLDEFIRREGLL